MAVAELTRMNIFKSLSAWLGRLSVSRKLTLIYLLDLTAVIYVSGILIHEKYLSIDFARKEMVGVAYGNAVRDVLLGTLTPAGWTDAQRQQSGQALQLQRQQQDVLLQSGTDSARFEEALQSLPQRLEERSANALQPVIESARRLLTTVGNQSNLILDPDLDSYYTMSLAVLRFPELVQVLNETDLALQAKQQASEESQKALRSTALLILAGRLDAIRQGIESDYAQAYAASGAGLRPQLQTSQADLDRALTGLLTMVKGLSERDLSAADLPALRALQDQTLQSLSGSWRAVSGSLDGLLRARIDGQFAKMWLHLGTALGLLLAILSLVYTVARLISSPLKHLDKVADEVRQTGNYNLRAQWHSQDEIGHLVETFNDMLVQLDRDRGVRQELAASARAAQTQLEMVEAIPIAMVVTSVPEHEVLHANAPAAPWLAGRSTDPWRHGMEAGVRSRFFQRLYDHDRIDEFEVRWTGGAEPSWAVLSARRLQFQGREALLTTFTPINVLKLMEQRLELWSKVFEASSEGIIILDAQQRVLSVNAAYCRATSYDYYEVVGERLPMLLGQPDEGAGNLLGQEIALAIEKRHEWQGEARLRKRSGQTYPAWLMVSAVRESSRQGGVSHYICISIDITDRKRTEARVQFLAKHDVLTELPNRALCVETLEAALQQAHVSGECLAVLFIDLDRFKVINDTLGHHVGDGLLRSVAQRLQQGVRAGDLVSRLGGDEFVVILRDLQDPQQARWQVEQRLIPLIRQPHRVQEHEINVSCSVGISVFPVDGKNLDELMRRSDAAMYDVKASGRDGARLFDAAMDDAIQERNTLEQLLRQALERKEFSLHYQPRLDGRSGAVLGVEALLRWNSAELGAVSPARFIPLAEECGLIQPIGHWVLHEACRQRALWQRQGLGDLAMSINLSAAQLAAVDVVEQVQRALTEQQCDPQGLELEITESQLMADAQVATEKLTALKALGLQLSIDDFGTGYSSLAYLKRFPIDKLKIDQSFVRDMLEDAADRAIVQAIVVLGHTLGLTVVAEGVEEQAQADMLRSWGCDELQGYHFSRPVAAGQLEAWLREGGQVLQRRQTLTSLSGR